MHLRQGTSVTERKENYFIENSYSNEGKLLAAIPQCYVLCLS